MAFLGIGLVLAASHPIFLQYAGIPFFMAGLVLMPFSVKLDAGRPGHMRYAWASLLLTLVYWRISSDLVLLFAIYAFIFYLLEAYAGRLNYLPPLLAIICSPLTHYGLDLFSFPVRLQLSGLAGRILNGIGYSAKVEGNMIYLGEDVYAVDPVCMGLNMIVTSLLAGVVMLILLELRKQQTIRLRAILLYFIPLIPMVLLANLFRIVGLVITGFPPEHTGHELVGIGALGIFVLMPLIYWTKYFNRVPGIFMEMSPQKAPVSIKWNLVFTICLISGLLTSRLLVSKNHMYVLDDRIKTLELPGYQKDLIQLEEEGDAVARFQNDKAIIYLKAQDPLRLNNHNPKICWKGSGFEIQEERVIEIAGREVYLALLVNPSVTYYTTWWYDNGEDQTIDHLSWRWKSRKRQPYCMVNVTAGSMEEVLGETMRWGN